LLRFKSVVRSRWIANNIGWHHALLCRSAGARSRLSATDAKG
jgi:hypothetical protein